MNQTQYQYHLAETLQDLTLDELACIYENYIDEATVSLMNGLISECNRRGLSLNDLEDHLINN